MNYEKQNFVDDQPLTAEQLNHMEEGIAAAVEAIDNLPDEMNTARLVVENPVEQDCGVVMTNHDDGILLLEGKSNGREVVLRHLAPGQNQNDAVTVWQLQHTIESAIAAQMDAAVDTAIKDTIDRTCPAFSESGAIVTCEPVEGYPLTVTAEFAPSAQNYLEGFDTYLLQDSQYVLDLQPGQYRISAEYDVVNPDGGKWLALKKSVDGGASWTTYAMVHEEHYSGGVLIDEAVEFTVTGKAGELWAIESGEGFYYIYSLLLHKDINRITRCGKNLVPNIGATNTTQGITFTANDDGSVVVSGTATKDAYYRMGSIPLKAGYKYHVSGCPSGGSWSTYKIYLYNSSFPNSDYLYEFGNGNTFTAEVDGTASTYISVSTGVTMTDMVFRPMVRLDGTDATFEKYQGGTFDPDDTIPALSGVNTIYADGGEVTVTGRANPVPIINSVLDRLAAVESAIVNNT